MPNWITNRIEFPDDATAAKAFELVGDGDYFDFAKLVPMPPELMIDARGDCREAMAWYLSDGGCDVAALAALETDRSCPRALRGLASNLPDAETRVADDPSLDGFYRDYGAKLAANIRNHGYPTWYEWSCANWGSKWNASQVSWNGREVRFETAWSGVPAIVSALSKALGCPLYYEFADEDFGCNCGEMVMLGEDAVKFNIKGDGGRESFMIASRLTDPEQEEFRFDEKSGSIVFNDGWNAPDERFESLPVIDTSPSSIHDRFLEMTNAT